MQPLEQQIANRDSREQDVHCFLDEKRRILRRCGGFSLVEMLVAISIIALLISVGVVVASKATAEARREQTRQMLESLLAANDQYKAVRGSNIALNGSSTLSSTEQFIAACLQVSASEEIMMAALNSSQSATLDRISKDGDNDGTYKSVYDRWGTEVEYRTSNDSSSTGSNGPANESGSTVDHTDLPTSRSPFFASAGPDKTWGTEDDINTVQQ